MFFKGSLLVGLLLGAQSFAGTKLMFQNASIDPVQKSKAYALSAKADKNAYLIVQFHKATTKEALEKAGLQVFRYIPEDAFVVRGDVSKLAASTVRAVVPYRGAFKLSNDLPRLSVFSTNKKAQLFIRLFNVVDTEAVLSQIAALDSSALVRDVSGQNLTVSMSESAIAKLAQVSEIEFVQMAPRIELFAADLMEDSQEPAVEGDLNTLNGYESGTKLINAQAAWDLGFHGEGEIVSFADTGLDTGKIETLASDFSSVKKGFNFGIGASSWEDPMGHGTHVAGSVAGKGVLSQGRITGVATGAELLPQGMWSPIIDNLTVPPKLNNLFSASYQYGARVHTNSWGSPANLGAYDNMSAQVDQFMWDNPDFLIIFAAGNSGVDANGDGRIDEGSVSTPGTAKNALTVGASENLVESGGIQKQVKELRNANKSWPAEPISSSKLSDNANGLAIFSSRGPTSDGRLKPEVVAPGTNILSNRSHHPEAEPLWGDFNKDYVWSGGTSMSTPIVAGAAAVTRQVLKERLGVSEPSSALVKAALMHTAFDLFPGQYGEGTSVQEFKTVRPNMDEGFGRVDLAKLVALGSGTSILDNKTGLATGEIYRAEIGINQGQSLQVTLVYTDAPGSSATAKALVNNVNLKLIKSGAVYATSASDINNFESLELKNLPSGLYTLEVSGENVPMGKNGKQPFALIYSVN